VTGRARGVKPKVLVIMGSDSDLPVMEEAGRTLDLFGIPYYMTVASAHRTPARTIKIVNDAEKSGVEVIIAGAGMAAHLPGVIASHTILPVIGVPLTSSQLNGMDALLSIVQMPPGIPVATVALGKAGAKNAGILAAQIMAVRDTKIAKKLVAHRKTMATDIEKKAGAIKKRRDSNS
jgi:phosphoribosylaminoimidazole carboxylase PurE protein